MWNFWFLKTIRCVAWQCMIARSVIFYLAAQFQLLSVHCQRGKQEDWKLKLYELTICRLMMLTDLINIWICMHSAIVLFLGKKSVTIKLIKLIQVVCWSFQTLLANTKFNQRDFHVSPVQELVSHVKICKPIANSYLTEYEQNRTCKFPRSYSIL
jgi:hypothetical protein